MKTKSEHITFRIEQAADDWEAVETLLTGKKYVQALFFSHLVIEKLCKAFWIKHNENNIPPRIHNLVYLIKQTPIEISESNMELMLNLNRFQLEGRYPEYVSSLYKLCDAAFTNNFITQTNIFKQWLLKQLQ